MDEPALRKLIEAIRSGETTPDEALSHLQRLPFADLGFAKVDHHRSLRQKTPEAVYGPGKTPIQAARIVSELAAVESSKPIVLTRANPEQFEAAASANPGWETTFLDPSSGQVVKRADDDETELRNVVRIVDEAGPITVVWRKAPQGDRRVAVVTAGTADLGVGAECMATLEANGVRTKLFADCGVAGVHRLLEHSGEILGADGVIVIAGMEGALASLVGGIAAGPVVAVPTSVGYGSGLDGVTALLAMLSSCASGISVVGIDNGYGAACAMARILL